MVIISLKQGPKGSWSVSRAHVTLFSDLQLDAAIALAKEVAHDEHLRTGRPIRVEMPGHASTLVLARYLDTPEASANDVMEA
ncbi:MULTISPECIES: hypothetical protein [unclassified Rhodanobacter]|jgi:hypothetical protein|uniref:hypothetical protein n=1 Tax=unclassified Rhodanobacter TaxID=2621553 RepID=UPI00161D6AE0|nr:MULTISPECIES: hypothetical protein [unclassified Rhodanobacter]MBB6243090.1 hypothetical protein [Rhodanobacter sp. MP1X3]MBB6246537.1 hypothetical protein [Rhodanobacter sp. A1T4]